MMDAVEQTLKIWRSLPFEWGNQDCMLSVGDYIARRGGLDVSSGFRGTYWTELAAKSHMDAYGGAAGLIDLTGIQRIEGSPQRGDVVVVALEGDAIGGICTGDMVALRLLRGVGEVSLRFVQLQGVWRCPL